MIEPSPPFRRAAPDDAPVIAELMNMAGEGLPLYLWQQTAGAGNPAWDIGIARARRDTGSFSYRNTVLRLVDDEIAACLIGFPLDDEPPVPNYAGMPPMFVPLQELEDQAPGTWYINALATLPKHRGRGYGGELLTLAESIGASAGKRGLSLIVANSNHDARRLYLGRGFREVATRPMVKEGWQSPGSTDWILMRKDFGR
jgi:ribosomal protein S18 acetylase RimI-like enzyme